MNERGNFHVSNSAFAIFFTGNGLRFSTLGKYAGIAGMIDILQGLGVR